MNWIPLKITLPTAIPEWYLRTHDCSGRASVLVFGWDRINFYPRYEVMHINDVAESKPEADGRYIIDELIVTHWQHITQP